MKQFFAILAVLLLMNFAIGCGPTDEDDNNDNGETQDKCKSVECEDYEECNSDTGACDLKDDKCKEDDDCEDNESCNDSNECEVDEVDEGCTNDADCEEGVCDEDSGDCVECLEDGDCEDNESCNDSNKCEVDEDADCTDDSDCDGEDPYCDPESGYCVECTQSDHCEADHECSDFICMESLIDCTEDADCEDTEGLPLCDTDMELCVECLSNENCSGETPVCNDDGLCEAAGDGTCVDDAVANDFSYAQPIEIPYEDTHHICTGNGDYFNIAAEVGDLLIFDLFGFDVDNNDLDRIIDE